MEGGPGSRAWTGCFSVVHTDVQPSLVEGVHISLMSLVSHVSLQMVLTTLDCLAVLWFAQLEKNVRYRLISIVIGMWDTEVIS